MANDLQTQSGFGYKFWRLMFILSVTYSMLMMFVLYPCWLGWLSPRVYLGWIPLMTLIEWSIDLGFGISAWVYLFRYWPGRFE